MGLKLLEGRRTGKFEYSSLKLRKSVVQRRRRLSCEQNPWLVFTAREVISAGRLKDARMKHDQVSKQYSAQWPSWL